VQLSLQVVPVTLPGKKRQWGVIVTQDKQKRHPTQHLAVVAATMLGKKHKLEVVIRRPDGKIRDRRSHGYDSRKRKG
jgi:ribulose bisphosphate carboxylase small subunit